MSTANDQWIETILTNAQPIIRDPVEEELVKLLVQYAYHTYDSAEERQLSLAALFDLVVSAEYYRSVAHTQWLYCPAHPDQPLLLYPYTNTCPRCVLTENFIFHEAHKPKSGAIGAATSRLLIIFLQAIFTHNKQQIELFKGIEPVDLVIIDKATSPQTVMFAEIKSAPLVTLPLAITSQALTAEQEDTVTTVAHRVTDHGNLYGSMLNILLPQQEGDEWHAHLFPIGSKANQTDSYWAYRGLIALIEQWPCFLPAYLDFWQQALSSYTYKSQSHIFWLTNACGQPSPRPEAWPRRSRATGFESISDSKTSVGMDRTDDLKKATYQVLKIGAEGKPSIKYRYKVGLVSNIHAVRHFDEYMLAFQDIIWTREPTGKIVQAHQLPPNTELFNLFDGIIALTNSIARDEWIQATFTF